MWMWNNYDPLKGTFKYIENLTNEQRAILFFNKNKFNPIIASSKSNDIRILILAFQRYNFYCSKYKIYKRKNKQLCSEDFATINKYFNNNNNNFFIKYDEDLDIYKLNIEDQNREDELCKYYVDTEKIFSKYEWENIMFYFKGIEYIAKNKRKFLTSILTRDEMELISLHNNLKVLKIKKEELENSLTEDNLDEINSEIDEINSEIDEIISKISDIEDRNPDYNDKLDNYGGRKHPIKTKRRKTKRRKTKRRKTKRRKIL